jgi:hypothetical protein
MAKHRRYKRIVPFPPPDPYRYRKYARMVEPLVPQPAGISHQSHLHFLSELFRVVLGTDYQRACRLSSLNVPNFEQTH